MFDLMLIKLTDYFSDGVLSQTRPPPPIHLIRACSQRWSSSSQVAILEKPPISPAEQTNEPVDFLRLHHYVFHRVGFSRFKSPSPRNLLFPRIYKRMNLMNFAKIQYDVYQKPEVPE